MPLIQKALLTVVIVFFLLSVGYVKGRITAREEILLNTILAQKKSDTIKNEVDEMSSYDVCRYVGGLHEECSSLMYRLEQASKNK